ncbi:MAG: tRNA (adenosine(37)-N6)-threonylcarbamoyltransferase complex ATPase subunit type 1 TsaE [Clostridia bacterium]|nr:tRNA (adenosine(37)-N6)-threonylcarbamoyltransferase complex ATPase subunit type 1 TsaE [Clostridia bacterium]
MKLRIKNESETRRFGLSLAQELEPGDVVCLVGDLGTGKTALTKAIAEGLGVTENIISPTFNIVKEYHSGRLPLYHFDVYRLGGPEELYDIGADEYFDGDGVCVVEWADIVAEAIPEGSRLIRIQYGSVPDERIYDIGETE